jgi:5-formyltetrahydrofolate cyclo-ligase
MMIDQNKALMRDRLREARQHIPPKERAAATREVCQRGEALICERIKAQDQIQDQAVVSGFWPIRDEIDIRPLLIQLNKVDLNCALPVVVGKQQPLAFRQWQLGEALKENERGLHQPSEDAPIVSPQILIVPLLACDRDGYRLGWGAGYYDRTLEQLRASSKVVAIGVGFELQHVDKVPRDRHDQRLDFMVTEKGVVEYSE